MRWNEIRQSGNEAHADPYRLILLGYEYELVDESGRPPKSLPQPDRNDIQMVSSLVAVPKGYSSDHSAQARPIGVQCYLKFKRVIED